MALAVASQLLPSLPATPAPAAEVARLPAGGIVCNADPDPDSDSDSDWDSGARRLCRRLIKTEIHNGPLPATSASSGTQK